MAVAYIMLFDDAREEKYDAVTADLGLDGTEAQWPDGIISHTAGKTADGWCVIDVWESAAQFEAFRDARLGPAMAKVGDIGEPKMTTFEVHNRYPAA